MKFRVSEFHTRRRENLKSHMMLHAYERIWTEDMETEESYKETCSCSVPTALISVTEKV
jgi:hypothetical protein